MTNQPPKPPAPQNLPLELPAGLEVEYANLVRIAHSPAELLFDFAHLVPGTPSARIRSRIVMSPLGAKLFHRALSENLARYEAAFGEIAVPGDPTLADHLFRPAPPTDQPPQK